MKPNNDSSKYFQCAITVRLDYKDSKTIQVIQKK